MGIGHLPWSSSSLQKDCCWWLTFQLRERLVILSQVKSPRQNEMMSLKMTTTQLSQQQQTVMLKNVYE